MYSGPSSLGHNLPQTQAVGLGYIITALWALGKGDLFRPFRPWHNLPQTQAVGLGYIITARWALGKRHHHVDCPANGFGANAITFYLFTATPATVGSFLSPLLSFLRPNGPK
jgi:hypothetical protein